MPIWEKNNNREPWTVLPQKHHFSSIQFKFQQFLGTTVSQELYLPYWTVIPEYSVLCQPESPLVPVKSSHHFETVTGAGYSLLGSDLCGGSRVPSVPCPQGMLSQPLFHLNSTPPFPLLNTQREDNENRERVHITGHQTCRSGQLAMCRSLTRHTGSGPQLVGCDMSLTDILQM